LLAVYCMCLPAIHFFEAYKMVLHAVAMKLQPVRTGKNN
jgi:hypothetical protein